MDKNIDISTVLLAVKNNLMQITIINCFVVGLSLVYLLFFHIYIYIYAVFLQKYITYNNYKNNIQSYNIY